MLMMRASVSLNLSNHWGTGLLVVKKELEPAEPQAQADCPKAGPADAHDARFRAAEFVQSLGHPAWW